MATQEMKTNEQQNQPSQGQQLERNLVRGAGHPVGLAIAPADFFRMTPFALMRRMTDEMDRVIGEFGFSRGSENPVWAPAIEVAERDGNYVVRAEIPGVKADEVKLEITDDEIVLQGERKNEREETKGDVHMTERQYGRFYRRLPLPEGARLDEARARFDNGVLEITVPLEEPKNKRREIKIEPASATQAGASTSSGKAA